MGSYKQLLLAVFCVSAVLPVLAQSPPASSRDERAVTMRVLDPDASEAAEVVRKIPPRKPKRSGEAADGRARDLASPGGNDQEKDEAGHSRSGRPAHIR